MGLVKCPDCGKMVSERAQSCPFCGCPSNFFESQSLENHETTNSASNIKEKKEIEGNENEINNEHEQNTNGQGKKEEFYESFIFLGKTISYPKCSEIYISAMKLHNNTAAKLEKEFEKQYKAANNIDNVWDNVVPAGQYAIDKIIKENVGLLYKAGIYITEEDFKRKYCIVLFNYLTKMSDAYDSIISDANDLLMARQYERSGRSHWEGGGFGIKGAVSGALKAGALNAVTGAGRAISDSVVDNKDNANLEKQKQLIYENEDYKDEFLYGLRRCIALADIGMAEEYANKGMTQRINIDFQRAVEQFSVLFHHEKNEYIAAQKTIDIINLYPLMPMFYRSVISTTIAYDSGIDDMMRFLQFWNMREDYVMLFVDERKRKVINEYLKNHPEIKRIDFDEYDPNTYLKVKKAKEDLIGEQKKITNDLSLPITVPVCLKINDYFDNCLNREKTLDSVEVLEGLSDNTTAIEFAEKVCNEKTHLRGLLKNVWVYGDKTAIPKEKILNKWKLPKNDNIYMYQNSAIFGTTFGGNGFVLTDTLICDLKSRKIIMLNDVNNIVYDHSKRIIIVYADGKSISINVEDEKPASRLFLYRCLEYFIQHYSLLIQKECRQTLGCQNSSVNEEMESEHKDKQTDAIKTIVCSNCNSEINSNVKFCNYCGTPSPLYFTKCPSCGEIIKKGVKFCNYCGQAIN